MATGAELTRRLLDAYAAHGVDGLEPVLADDFEFVVTPEVSAEPDVYVGMDGARRYFEAFGGALDDLGYELLETDEVRPGVTVATIRFSARGAGTGIALEQVGAATIEHADDRITRMQAFADAEAARAAAQRAG